MSFFVAGLTNENPNIIPPVDTPYHHVQYNDILPASATASVSFPPSTDMFRYVIIQQQIGFSSAMCLAEVKVFSRGSLLYHAVCYFYFTVGSCRQGSDPSMRRAGLDRDN